MRAALRSALSSRPTGQSGAANGSDTGLEFALECSAGDEDNYTVSLRHGLVLTGYCDRPAISPGPRWAPE